MQHIKIYEEFVNELDISNNEKRDVIIYKMENGFYWLKDYKTGELIDGDRRLYVVKDMAKRWNYNIKKE